MLSLTVLRLKTYILFDRLIILSVRRTKFRVSEHRELTMCSEVLLENTGTISQVAGVVFFFNANKLFCINHFVKSNIEFCSIHVYFRI